MGNLPGAGMFPACYDDDGDGCQATGRRRAVPFGGGFAGDRGGTDAIPQSEAAPSTAVGGGTGPHLLGQAAGGEPAPHGAKPTPRFGLGLRAMSAPAEGLPVVAPQGGSPSGSPPSSFFAVSRCPSEAGTARVLTQARSEWAALQHEVERKRRANEFDGLIAHSRGQMRVGASCSKSLPANRYGSDARLPAFDHEASVPILALLNPFSGAGAGGDILAIARQSPYYCDRFFNIIDVVKDQRRGGLLDVFRIELTRAKEEAKLAGVRPRLISGGGDGTASFTLFLLFAALRADTSRADDGFGGFEGGLFIWPDSEMEQFFPAIAQMPLGSANDFGHTLGWGKRYPGDAEAGRCFGTRASALAALGGWVAAASARSSRIANFDVFGIVPAEGQDACDFKVCELTGPRGITPKVQMDGGKSLLMKEAGLPVPLFLCLYFSAGFAAYMTARFQMNRRRTPLQNKMEYARQACGIVAESVPPQLNAGLLGVQITCGPGDKQEPYFPPRAESGNTGRPYREVGFLNINWQAGMANGADRAPLCARATCSTREPAKFNDGMLDMYRLKAASLVKNPGLRWQTDKKEGGMTLRHEGGRGKGIFFQWDGEARYAFSPSGGAFSINIRKMLNIPVVLGPEYDRRVTGDPDNGEPVRFAFAGESAEQRDEFRQRVLRGVCGDLNSELLATAVEMASAGVPCREPPAKAPDDQESP